MKVIKSLLLAFVLACGIIGCQHGKLEPGGAYAPVDTNGVPTLQADFGFYLAEATYRTVHSAGMAVFQFELDNRPTLWKLSPKIKQDLDKIRPDFWKYNGLYLRARTAYQLHPTQAGLDTMNSALAKLRQFSDAAQAVAPQLLKN